MQAEQLHQRTQQLGKFVRGKAFKFVIAGSLIVLGVLMLIGSFAFSWVEVDEVFGEDDTITASAMTIWIGGNDDIKTLDIEAEEDAEGFGAVRLLDRILILLPLGALTLIVLATVYLFLMSNFPWLTPLRTLVGLAGISCFLLLFPLIWESLSTNNWRNFEGGDFVLLFVHYSTIEQQILGFLAFLIATTGLVLYLLSEQGALGAVPSGSSGPSQRQSQRQAPPQARSTLPRQPGQPEPSIPSPQPPTPPSQSS